MIISFCKYCEKEIKRNGYKPGVFCSRDCKAQWQRTQKPVDKDWLYQKYVVEKLGTVKIAKLVNRDPKRVYEWLLDFGIPVRERDWDLESGNLPFHSRDWLYEQYVVLSKSTGDIAREYGVTDAGIRHWLLKHKIKRRTISEARSVKRWGQSGEDNPMFGRTGDKNVNYKGGCSPERQAFYSSREWAIACRSVWQRDEARCQRCGAEGDKKNKLHVHHIVSFAVKHLRADVDNLILLCCKCHRFVHSKKNVERLFLKDIEND